MLGPLSEKRLPSREARLLSLIEQLEASLVEDGLGDAELLTRFHAVPLCSRQKG